MRKIYAVTAILVLILTIGGCKPKTPVDTETTPKTSETTESDTETKPAATTKTEETTSAIESVETSTEVYTQEKAAIEYPSVSGIQNQTLSNDVNAVIKGSALSVIEGLGLDPAKDTINIQSKIHTQTKDKLVLTYSGTYTKEGEKKAVPVEYHLTLNLATGKTVRLSNYISPSALAEKLKSGQGFAIITDQASLKSRIKDYLINMELEEYIELFEKADFSADAPETFPQVTSYERNGSIVFTFPLPEELGRYITLSFTPDNK